jgi:hypothetical protein
VRGLFPDANSPPTIGWSALLPATSALDAVFSLSIEEALIVFGETAEFIVPASSQKAGHNRFATHKSANKGKPSTGILICYLKTLANIDLRKNIYLSVAISKFSAIQPSS